MDFNVTPPVSRRSLLVASSCGLAGLSFGRPLPAAQENLAGKPGRAKSTILFFLSGGASHIDCLTDVLAGGGIRGGQTYGASDRFAEYPASKPVTPADVTKTVYQAMGIQNLEALDNQNRPYNLLAEGNPINELF